MTNKPSCCYRKLVSKLMDAFVHEARVYHSVYLLNVHLAHNKVFFDDDLRSSSSYCYIYEQQHLLHLDFSVEVLCPIHTADATQLSSWVASVVCTQFATSWRQSRRVWINFANSEVELRRVGGVNAPVGSRDPAYNFLCYWWQVTPSWRHCWKS